MPFDVSLQDENLTNLAFTRLQSFLLRNVRSSKGRNTPTGQFDIPQIRSQARALRYDLIQINGPKLTRYIVHDIDSKHAYRAWVDAGLPRPTFIVINPRNEHAHYLYELTTGFHTDPDHPRYSKKTIRYISAISRGQRQAMIDAGYKVDTTYQGYLVKNPWYSGWQVIAYDRAYSFDELRGTLNLSWTRPNTAAKDSEINPSGRNCTLFDRLRFWAYRSVRFYPDQSAFETALHEQVREFSQDFVSLVDFHEREFGDIVKSVCKYTWNRYLSGHYHTDDYTYKVKVLNLPDDMDLVERELAGQQYTCDQRNDKTRNKILQAMQQLQSDGRPVSKSAIARLTGLSRNTVISHWPHVSIPVPDTAIGTCGSDILPQLFPTADPVTNKVTVETEYPSGTSLFKEGFALCEWADTTDPQLHTPHDDETTVYYSSSDVIGFKEYQRNWSQKRDRPMKDGHMDVAAFIAAMNYAWRLADRGILVDDLPSGIKDYAIKRMDIYYRRKWGLEPP